MKCDTCGLDECARYRECLEERIVPALESKLRAITSLARQVRHNTHEPSHAVLTKANLEAIEALASQS